MTDKDLELSFFISFFMFKSEMWQLDMKIFSVIKYNVKVFIQNI